MDTIDRIMSDKNATREEKIVCQRMREYCDSIPYTGDTKKRRNFLNNLLVVLDTNSLERHLVYQTTKFGYQGKKRVLKSGKTKKTFMPISAKKVTEKMIENGKFPTSYYQTNTKRLPGSVISKLSDEEQKSREVHLIEFVDHGSVVDHELNHLFVEIHDKTGYLPKIDFKNAHTGRHACIFSLSIMDAESHALGLRSAYSKNNKFGMRLEHHDLGENYELLNQTIEDQVSIWYGNFLSYVDMMQKTSLRREEKEYIKEGILNLLFRYRKYSPDHYQCNLEFLFHEENFVHTYTMWDRMIIMVKALNRTEGIPYHYVNKNGQNIHATKRFHNRKTNQLKNIFGHRELCAQVVELFFDVVDERKETEHY